MPVQSDNCIVQLQLGLDRGNRRQRIIDARGPIRFLKGSQDFDLIRGVKRGVKLWRRRPACPAEGRSRDGYTPSAGTAKLANQR